MISETMICCQPSLAPPLLARRGRRTSHSFGASHMMFLLVGEYSFTPGCQTDVHYIWRVLFERESTTHPAWKIEYSAANQHKNFPKGRNKKGASSYDCLSGAMSRVNHWRGVTGEAIAHSGSRECQAPSLAESRS